MLLGLTATLRSLALAKRVLYDLLHGEILSDVEDLLELVELPGREGQLQHNAPGK